MGCGGPSDRDLQTLRVFTRREVNTGAVQFGDPGNDGQSEAAAGWLLSPVQAMEAAQDRLAVGGGNSGAAVADVQVAPTIGDGYPDTHRAAGRCVADGVVDQIADQHAQPFRLAGDDAAGGGSEREIEILFEYLVPETGADGFSQHRQIDRLRIGQSGLGVEASQL